MNKKLTGLMTLAALLSLTACGSGGKHSDQFSANAGGSNTVGSDNKAENNNSSKDKQKKIFQGFYGSIDASNKPKPQNPAAADGTVNDSAENKKEFTTQSTTWEVKNLDALEVDGRSILIIPVGKKADDEGYYESTNEEIYTGSSTAPYHKENSNSWRMVAAHLKHARYGEMYDEYEKRHVFTLGESTPDQTMAKLQKESHDKGRPVVMYRGRGLHHEAGEKLDKKPIKTLSEFRVNFGDKSLDGTITNPNVPNFKNVNFKATIKGSIFEGSDTAPNGDAYVKGGFYGENAEEMAGAYAIPREGGGIAHGTFGAAQVK